MDNVFMGFNNPQMYDVHNLTSTSNPQISTYTTIIPNLINESNFATNNNNNTVSMDSFYPALVQCFGIIICGYLAGRFKVITNADSKGLSTFAGTFALPCQILYSLVELDWRTVNWTFLAAVFISKTLVFIIVILITLLVGRSQDLGKAGLYGVFCTQSNDFAIGYPILQALYSKVHPEYAAYLYLMAPISLAILNPIGMVLLEISRIMKIRKEASAQRVPSEASSSNPTEQLSLTKRWLNGRTLMVINLLRALIFNPMLLMTLLGVGAGFVFPNGLPEIIGSTLRTLGQSFSATALFLLGLKIVGQESFLNGNSFLLSIILTLVKILVLPLVSRQTVNIMQAGENFNDTTELSTYAFLYGTFPTAPGAFVIATQYNSEPELIASSMVLCTFISAPLMFISAKMISLKNISPESFLGELDDFSIDMSIVGIVAGIWVGLLLIVTRAFKRMPQRITLCLVISQLMSCAAVVMWSQTGKTQVPEWILYLQFFLFNVGTYSSWLWTAVLAIVMLFSRCRDQEFVLKSWSISVFLVCCVSVILTTLLAVLDNSIVTSEKHNPSAHYGTVRTAVSVFLLVMCFIVTVGCLILLQRYVKNSKKINSRTESSDETSFLQGSVSTADLLRINGVEKSARGFENQVSVRSETSSVVSSDNEETNDVPEKQRAVETQNHANGAITTACSEKKVVDIEDLLDYDEEEYAYINNVSTLDFLNTTVPCCDANVPHNETQQNNAQDPVSESNTEDNDNQFLRHTILLIMLLCSMFVNLSISIWSLVMDGMSGIYMEISFLDAFLDFGQCAIVLALFITDTSALIAPFMKIWRYIWYGANVLVLPPHNYLSSETEDICDQFRAYHLSMCKKAIAKDRRWRIKVYHQVFYGHELVDWLIENGLAKDRIGAVHYARRLVDGRVLFHINNIYHFQDANLLYKFCNRFQSTEN